MRSLRFLGFFFLGVTVAVLARQLAAQSANGISIPRQTFGTPTASGVRSVGPASPPTATAPSTTPVGSESAVPVSYLRQSTFAIPFNVAGDTVDVQLYVSIDRGSSWHLYTQQKPDARRFRFRASQDGEYWFASRTVDRNGQGRPASITKPERRVFVDSRQPRLTVQATMTANGEVQASWDADDENLATQTFRIGYRTDNNATWQLVTAPPLEPLPGKPASGQVAWRPTQGARVLQIHVEVADSAGNWAVVEKQLSIPPTANTGGAPPGATLPGALTSSVPVVPPTGSSADDRAPERQPLTSDTPGYDASGFPRTGGSTVPNNPSAASSVPPSDSNTAPLVPSVPGDLPGNERPRMSASRSFSLEYDIESAGPGGVADVELWMTRDRGATWTRFGTDADKNSPFDVEVNADGIYGVRIVVISGSGLASTAPRPNDPADLWVGVDTTRPTAQFSSVSYGEGQKAGQLDIRWLADDLRFGPRPITLSYAETTAGPWTTIASGLPNTGQYFWAVDAHVPKKVVLRIEARDEAGNSTQHELTDPVSLLGLTPSARVKGIQPK